MTKYTLTGETNYEGDKCPRCGSHDTAMGDTVDVVSEDQPDYLVCLNCDTRFDEDVGIINESKSNETEYNTLWDLWHGKGHFTTGMTGNDKAEMVMLSGMTFDDPYSLTLLDREDLPDDMQQFLQQNPASLIKSRPFDAESLDPKTTDITICVVCGRDIDSHSNPNTDYRGMKGDAPPTDHYFSGGMLGDSDDKLYFESKATEFDSTCPVCGKELPDEAKSPEFKNYYDTLIDHMRDVHPGVDVKTDYNLTEAKEDFHNDILKEYINYMQNEGRGTKKTYSEWLEENGYSGYMDNVRSGVFESLAKEFKPELQGRKIKILSGDHAGRIAEVTSVGIFDDNVTVNIDGNNYYNIPKGEFELVGESRATEKGETYIFMWRKMDENMRKDMLRSTWNSEYEVASYKGTDWEQLPDNVKEDLKVKMNELFRESAHDGESYAKEEDQEWEELVRDARLEIHPDAEQEPEEFPEKKGEEGDPLELGFKHNDPVPKSGINKQLGGVDQAHMYAKGQTKQSLSDLMGDPEGYDWQKGGETKSEMELTHGDWGNTQPYWCMTCGAGGEDIEDIESHYDLTGHGERRNPKPVGEAKAKEDITFYDKKGNVVSQHPDEPEWMEGMNPVDKVLSMADPKDHEKVLDLIDKLSKYESYTKERYDDSLYDAHGLDADGFDKDGFSWGYNGLPFGTHRSGTMYNDDALRLGVGDDSQYQANNESDVYDYVKSHPNSTTQDILVGLGWQNGTTGHLHIENQERKGHIQDTGNGFVAESYSSITRILAEESDISHDKCPACNFETSWKEGDSWQEKDAEREMDDHIETKHKGDSMLDPHANESDDGVRSAINMILEDNMHISEDALVSKLLSWDYSDSEVKEGMRTYFGGEGGPWMTPKSNKIWKKPKTGSRTTIHSDDEYKSEEGRDDPQKPGESEMEYWERTGQILSARVWDEKQQKMVDAKTGKDEWSNESYAREIDDDGMNIWWDTNTGQRKKKLKNAGIPNERIKSEYLDMSNYDGQPEDIKKALKKSLGYEASNYYDKKYPVVTPVEDIVQFVLQNPNGVSNKQIQNNFYPFDATKPDHAETEIERALNGDNRVRYDFSYENKGWIPAGADESYAKEVNPTPQEWWDEEGWKEQDFNWGGKPATNYGHWDTLTKEEQDDITQRFNAMIDEEPTLFESKSKYSLMEAIDTGHGGIAIGQEDYGKSSQKCTTCGKEFDVADNEGIMEHVRDHRVEYGEDFEPSFITKSLEVTQEDFEYMSRNQIYSLLTDTLGWDGQEAGAAQDLIEWDDFSEKEKSKLKAGEGAGGYLDYTDYSDEELIQLKKDMKHNVDWTLEDVQPDGKVEKANQAIDHELASRGIAPMSIEAMYGFGSATGRMSPAEHWKQGLDAYGDMGYDSKLGSPMYNNFQGMSWNELPEEIKQAYMAKHDYIDTTQTEALRAIEDYAFGSDESVDDPEDIAILDRLLDNEEKEQEKGDDEEEDIALIAQLLDPEEKANEDVSFGSAEQAKFESLEWLWGITSTDQHRQMLNAEGWGDDNTVGGDIDEFRKDREEQILLPYDQLSINIKGYKPEESIRRLMGVVGVTEAKKKAIEDNLWQSQGQSLNCPVCGADFNSGPDMGDHLIVEHQWEESDFEQFEEGRANEYSRKAEKVCDFCHEEQGTMYKTKTGKDICEYCKGEGKEGYKDSDRKVSPSSYMHFTEPVDVPTGRNILDQTYGTSEPETKEDPQDLTGKSLRRKGSQEYESITKILTENVFDYNEDQIVDNILGGYSLKDEKDAVFDSYYKDIEDQKHREEAERRARDKEYEDKKKKEEDDYRRERSGGGGGNVQYDWGRHNRELHQYGYGRGY